MNEKIVLIFIPIEDLKEIIDVVQKKLETFSYGLKFHQPPQKVFLTAKEVCQLPQIHTVTLWRYTKDGKLRQHRIGRRVLCLSGEVRKALMNGWYENWQMEFSFIQRICVRQNLIT